MTQMSKLSAATFAMTLLLGLFVSPHSNAESRYVLEASPHAFNRVVLPEPFEQFSVPKTSAGELADEPIRTNDDRGVLLLPEEDAEDFEIVIELESGDTFILRVETNPEITRGQVFRYRDAVDKAPAPVTAERDKDQWLRNTFIGALNAHEIGQESGGDKGHDSPPGFERADKPSDQVLKPDLGEESEVRIKMTGVQTWRDNNHVLKVYKLSANHGIDLAPQDFYRDNVVAIYLEDEHLPRGGVMHLLSLEERDDE